MSASQFVQASARTDLLVMMVVMKSPLETDSAFGLDTEVVVTGPAANESEIDIE